MGCVSSAIPKQVINFDPFVTTSEVVDGEDDGSGKKQPRGATEMLTPCQHGDSNVNSVNKTNSVNRSVGSHHIRHSRRRVSNIAHQSFLEHDDSEKLPKGSMIMSIDDREALPGVKSIDYHEYNEEGFEFRCRNDFTKDLGNDAFSPYYTTPKLDKSNSSAMETATTNITPVLGNGSKDPIMTPRQLNQNDSVDAEDDIYDVSKNNLSGNRRRLMHIEVHSVNTIEIDTDSIATNSSLGQQTTGGGGSHHQDSNSRHRLSSLASISTLADRLASAFPSAVNSPIPSRPASPGSTFRFGKSSFSRFQPDYESDDEEEERYSYIRTTQDQDEPGTTVVKTCQFCKKNFFTVQEYRHHKQYSKLHFLAVEEHRKNELEEKLKAIA